MKKLGFGLMRLPEAAADILKKENPEAGFASWGIRFAASLDQVLVVLSGMSSLEQVEDNISYMKEFQPLTDKEKDTIAKTAQIINDSIAIPCTACRYCTSGCPKKIAIPEAAKMISEATGAELFKIEQKIPYAADYNTCIEQAKKDLQAKARPGLVSMRIVTVGIVPFTAAVTGRFPCVSLRRAGNTPPVSMEMELPP